MKSSRKDMADLPGKSLGERGSTRVTRAYPNRDLLVLGSALPSILPPVVPTTPRPCRVGGARPPIDSCEQRNKISYRLAHWPIWIWVFFIAPGPVTFDLFAHGPDSADDALAGGRGVGTGIAGLFGQLPGIEPAPYILRFNEDRPNPFYRRILLHVRVERGRQLRLLNIGRSRRRYRERHLAHARDLRPGIPSDRRHVLAARSRRLAAASAPFDEGEGQERRYFYGSVWAACIAQPMLWFLWKVLPQTRAFDIVKLVVFLAHPRVRRQSRAARRAPAHAAYSSRRDGRCAA